MRRNPMGIIQILLAATLWGCSVVAARWLLRDITPLALTHATVAVAGVTMAAVLAVLDRSLFRVTRPDLLRIAAVGSVAFAGSALLINVAILYTNAATAIVLNYVAPVLVLAWHRVTGAERLDRRKAFAVALCVSGCALTVGLAEGQLLFDIRGVLAGLGSATAFAFFTIVSKPIVERSSSLTFTLYAFISASLFFCLFHNPAGLVAVFSPPDRAGAVLVYVIALCTLPPILFFRGLRHVAPESAAVICSFEIVVAAAVGWLLLGESMHPSQLVGAALVIVSVILVETKSARPKSPA